MSDLTRQISELKHGDHICMVYENLEEQMAAAVPFIRDGIQREECCAYIAGEHTVEDVRLHLSKEIDVEEAEASGALLVLTKRDAYLRDESFDPQGMIEFLKNTVEACVAKGFNGFRVTGEMTWALGCHTETVRLVEYEACLNNFFPSKPALAICQYNRHRFSAPVIHDVLRTHPRAVIGDQVCPNIYYEPPDLILTRASLEYKVDWMLSQLRRAREAELKLQQFNHELEQQVTRKTASLHEVIGQLETFCHIIAHDLRAPLRAMEGFATALKEERSDQLDELARSYLERIMAGSTRAQRMVNDLLEYARIAPASTPLRPVNVGAVIAELMSDMDEELRRTGTRVTVHGQLPDVRAHGPTLKVIFSNFLTNAMKFVPASRKPEIDLGAEVSHERVRIWVKDNGPGISEELRSRIFGMFERGQAQQVQGAGMGLAIIRKAVERLGGAVGVQTGVGIGSTFWVELPRS